MRARDRLALALDVGDLDTALPLARRLAPWFGIAKVGYELYAEAGPDAFSALQDADFAVFADLKLHDIPNTVERGARALGRRGVAFLNFHAAGGEMMLRAGAEGLHEGAHDAGLPAPVALGVTVLTSDADTGAFAERLAWSSAAGLEGVVCGGPEIASAKAAGLRTMVPGVRLADGDAHDQARVTTPDAVARAGGDWLVIGRAVTAADDPEQAAAQITALVDAATASA